MFKAFAYVSGVLLSLISIKFILKSLISQFQPNFSQTITNKIWVLYPKYSVTISLSKIIYYSISVIIFTFWMIYFNNFLLMNFIAFSISYLVIKKFYFSNFYFIIFLFFAIILYNTIWLFINDVSFIDTFNLSSENIVNIPIIFLLPEIYKSPFQTNYFFSLLDLILIGFLLKYLKNTSHNLGKDYIINTRYTIYLGLVCNLVLFYFFKICMPFFILPGILSISFVIMFAVRRNEYSFLIHLEKQWKFNQNNKINKIYPLQIIGADQSLDFNELVANRKYLPPNVISEMDCIKEESPKDKPFVSHFLSSDAINEERRNSIN